jgi:hypothetical protein
MGDGIRVRTVALKLGQHRIGKLVSVTTSSTASVVEMRASRYFGLIDGSPPGVPGGGMTGIGSPEGGSICFIWGSISAGGAITPPERAKSELVVPLDGGVIGRFGLALSGRWSGSAARAAIAPNPTAAAAMAQVPRIAASSSLSSSKPE